jgi:hypothetical protein
VRVQVVENHPDALGSRVAFIDEPPHLVGEVLHRPLLSHRQMSVAPQRLAEEEEVAHPVALVLVVVTLRLTRRGGQRRAGLGDQLLARLVEADDGAGSSYGSAYKSSTSSMQATNSAATSGMHHCSFSHGLSSFF